MPPINERGRAPTSSHSASNALRVLYFGTYDRTYPRNAQVISCLRSAGVEVVEEHVAVWDEVRHAWRAGAATGARLAFAEARLLTRRPRGRYDAVIVGYPGHLDLPAARRAAQGAPVVFNALVSLADTFVADRARFARGSLAARALAQVDRRAFAAADLVVADTHAQARFFAELAPTRVAVCFVGAEERVFQPGWDPEDPFTAVFVGKLIPLHGVDVVLEAARLAPEVRIRIIGSGQLERLLADRPPNVEHVSWVDYERLPDELHRASCALGIFGSSAKAARVIPNKAFQALACGTPLVTADTAAARELLHHERSAVLIPAADPAALAGALERLAADRELAQRLSTGGRAAYKERASESVPCTCWPGIGERLR